MTNIAGEQYFDYLLKRKHGNLW